MIEAEVQGTYLSLTLLLVGTGCRTQAPPWIANWQLVIQEEEFYAAYSGAGVGLRVVRRCGGTIQGTRWNIAAAAGRGQTVTVSV